MEYDIVVVGAGIIGCAASFYLSKAKKKILLIDQFKIDNNLNASHDFSRALRCEYGKDEFYAKMAVKSLRLWKKIEKESGEQLYFNCGFLNISEKRQNYLDEGYEALKKLNQKADFLDEKQLRQKFPQLKGKFAVFDHNGGILDAPLAISSLLSLAKRNGVSVLENCRANKISNNSVLLDNKETIKFKKLVLAAGFWT
ncbi:FAD-dependent oxidoreductase, partial [Candidatus Woesearchaeota archaeon]|nr:FAD-dependent oxidoreductase [Candidatus Woesearchaeota archaeon]